MCEAQKQEDIAQLLHEAVIKKAVLPFVGWKTQLVVPPTSIYPQWFPQPTQSQNNHKAKCFPP